MRRSTSSSRRACATRWIQDSVEIAALTWISLGVVGSYTQTVSPAPIRVSTSVVGEVDPSPTGRSYWIG